MKLNKILAGFISGAVAATAMATSASAYITVPASPSALLTVNNQSWSKMISSSYNINYSELSQLQVSVTLTDPDAYEAEKASGFFSDGETAFVDFAGNIAFGSTTEWLAFNFDTLAETSGGSGLAAISDSGGGNYIMSASITSAQAENISGRCSVTFAEWGNTSDKYELTLNSFSLIDTNGEVVLQYDNAGNAVIEPSVAETTTATEAPVETTTTTTTAETTTTTTTTTTEATTTAEETTVVLEEVEETTAETTTTTTTTAAETTAETTIAETTTTAAATTTAAVAQAQPSQSDSFASRNNQLLIFAIAAVVIIIAVIVAFVLISLKKKR